MLSRIPRDKFRSSNDTHISTGDEDHHNDTHEKLVRTSSVHHTNFSSVILNFKVYFLL